MSDLFNVIFKGECLPGHEPTKVTANLAKLFHLPMEKATAFFSGKPVILKKGIDHTGALKYQAVLQKAGAQVHIKALTEKALPDDTANQPNAAKTKAASALSTPLTLAPANTGSFADVVEKKEPPPPPDTDHLSLSPAHTDFKDLAKPQPPSPVGDLSHLSLEPMAPVKKKNPFLDD